MRVPVYERRIGINPMPQPNIQPVMPTGDGGASAFKAIQGFTDRLIKLQQDHEDAQTLEAFTKFKNDSLEYHENPDKGIYNTRLGGAAKGVYSEADGWMRTKGEEYAQRLESNRAKANFRRMASDYINQRGQTNSRFEADQNKKYRIETADASIKNDLAEIESNWNNPEIINHARKRIQQSLELKLRGSSREAYNAAYAEIEDKIGVARIRQAYIQDPLLAVSMLEHPDIHLKPETAAQLREHLKNKTEIYELQAIAQTFSRHYTPENSVQAYNNLIQMYGADKGNKAYAQLNRIWNISQGQENAREHNISEAQRKNANDFIMRFNDPNKPDPTEQEIISAQNKGLIAPSTAHSFLGYVKSRNNEAERKAAHAEEERIKAEQARTKNAIWNNVLNKNFPSDEELSQFVNDGLIEQSFANWAISQREKYNNEQEQKKLNEQKQKQAETAHNFLMRTVTPGAVPLTAEEVRAAMEAGDIDDTKGKAYLDYINSQASKDEQQKIKARERLLWINADRNGFIPHEQLYELLDKGLITDEFAKSYRTKENQFNADRNSEQARLKAEQEKQERERAKAQAEADKKKHEQDLFNYSQNLAVMYPKGQEEKGLAEINNLPLEDREIARKYYRQHIDDQQTGIQNREQQSREIHDDLVATLEVSAIHGVHEDQSKLDYMLATKQLDRSEYNNLMKIRQDQENARIKAEQETRDFNNYNTALGYAKSNPLGNQGNVYDEIRAKYSRDDANDIISNYDRFIQEQRTIRNEQDKAKLERQAKNYNSLYQYWDKGQSVPNEQINKLFTAGDISREQRDKAFAMNATLSTRAGVEESLRNNPNLNFADKSRTEQEQLIMLQMGTNEEARKQNFTVLLQKAADGILTNEEIRWAWAHGKISSDDEERLKDFDNKFVKEQKALISRTANDMILEIKKLGIKNNSSLYENEALSDFYRAASTLDPHAENFSKALTSIYQSTLSNIFSRYAEGKKTSWWFPYDWETRLWASQERTNNYTVPENTPEIYYEPFTVSGDNGVILNPQGETTKFTNTVPIITPPPVSDDNFRPEEIVNTTPYFPQPRQPITPPPAPEPANIPSRFPRVANPQALPTLTGIVDLSRSFVPGNFRITSGYSATPTALRNGRGHRAIDIGTPENTPLRIPNGYNWRVTSTGNNNTAGNHVTISTQISNGDNVSVTFAHLNSFAVRRGDTLTPGDIFARTGNTGHSTGAHLHIAVKINGRTVNPLSVNMQESGVFNPEIIDYSQQDSQLITQPQPIVQPIVSSDDEHYQMAMQILGLGDNPLNGDISGDIFSTSLYGNY